MILPETSALNLAKTSAFLLAMYYAVTEHSEIIGYSQIYYKIARRLSRLIRSKRRNKLA